MIESMFYKNCQAVKLENEVLRVIILPELGGKVASIYNKDKHFELLFQNKESQYKRPQLYANFAEFDAAGFDDAFPAIDAGRVSYGEQQVDYPDHGEIWSANFACRLEEDKVSLTYHSRILDYAYEKTFFLTGDQLICRYHIVNNGNYSFPCIWAMHCLVRCQEDMEVIFPEGTTEVENVQESKLLGKAGKVHSFPITKDLTGHSFRLDRVLPAAANTMQKYYVRGKVTEGKCGIYYPRCNVRYTVCFDSQVLPYLGFWVTEGGFRGDYNCALEPATGYYDSIEAAQKNKALTVLQPGKCLDFAIKIALS